MAGWYRQAYNLARSVTMPSRRAISNYGVAAGITGAYLQRQAKKGLFKKKRNMGRRRRKHAIVYGDRKLKNQYVSDTVLKQQSLYLFNFTGNVSLGDGQDARESDKILLKHVNSTLQFNNNWNDLVSTTTGSIGIRCLLFDHDNYVDTVTSWVTNANLVVSDVFRNTTVPFTSPVDFNKVNKLYLDRTFIYQMGGTRAGHEITTHQVNIKRAINKQYTYKDIDGGHEAKEGNLYMALLPYCYGGATGTTSIAGVITQNMYSFTDL